jgi:hypothetical protein
MSSSSDEYESTDRSGDPGDLPSSEYKLTESGSGESGGVMAETKSVETSALGTRYLTLSRLVLVLVSSRGLR